jgi:hypothetical protein
MTVGVFYKGKFETVHLLKEDYLKKMFDILILAFYSLVDRYAVPFSMPSILVIFAQSQ